jgi:hypothetical protein
VPFVDPVRPLSRIVVFLVKVPCRQVV